MRRMTVMMMGVAKEKEELARHTLYDIPSGGSEG
jgi:hypothetical protein